MFVVILAKKTFVWPRASPSRCSSTTCPPRFPNVTAHFYLLIWKVRLLVAAPLVITAAASEQSDGVKVTSSLQLESSFMDITFVFTALAQRIYLSYCSAGAERSKWRSRKSSFHRSLFWAFMCCSILLKGDKKSIATVNQSWKWQVDRTKHFMPITLYFIVLSQMYTFHNATACVSEWVCTEIIRRTSVTHSSLFSFLCLFCLPLVVACQAQPVCHSATGLYTCQVSCRKCLLNTVYTEYQSTSRHPVFSPGFEYDHNTNGLNSQ